MPDITPPATPPAAPPPAAPPAAAPPPAAPPPPAALSTPPAEPPKGTALGEPPAAPSAAPPAAIDLKIPEGLNLDQKFVDTYKRFATDVGLDSPKAQKGLEFVLAAQVAALEGLEKRIHDEAMVQSSKWLEEAKADPELGGVKWDETVAVASKAVERFGGKGLREALNKTGLGNNPAVIRAFYLAGKAISEDSIGGKSSSAPPPANDPDAVLRKLYPSMFETKE